MPDRVRPRANRKAKALFDKMLRDAAMSADLDTRAPKNPATPEQRRALGKWLVDNLRPGKGTVTVPFVKRKGK